MARNSPTTCLFLFPPAPAPTFTFTRLPLPLLLLLLLVLLDRISLRHCLCRGPRIPVTEDLRVPVEPNITNPAFFSVWIIIVVVLFQVSQSWSSRCSFPREGRTE